jgi:hypothetical protein
VFIPLSHPPPTTPVERFVRIIDGLCFAIAARGPGGLLPAPLFFLLWHRLRRMATRVTQAAARIAASAPRPAARLRPAAPRPSRPQPPRLPGGFAWVVALVPGTAVYGGQLQALLADPGWAPLAEVPSVRRLLNPLRQMLGVPRPSPPPPRPAAIPPQPPEPRRGGTPTPAGCDPLSPAPPVAA